jgi:hypothetical protein
MPSFDIATGYVKFKGNLDEFDQDIAKANKKLKDMQEATGIGAGRLRMGAAESARIAKEMAQAAKESRKIMDLVTLGKFGVMVRDLKVSLNNFAAGAAKFGAGATAIGGAALASGASGSPLAQSTLEGSFKLLATTIGGTFTPLVKDASRGLQQLAKTWNSMSDGMKGVINDGAKFIGIAGLLSLGLAAVAKGFTALLSHPLIAAMSVGAGVLNFAHNANQKQGDAVARGQAEIFATTLDDAKKSLMGVRLSMLKPNVAADEARANLLETGRQYEIAQQKHANIQADPMQGGMSAIVSAMGLPSREESAREDVIAKGKAFEQAKFLANEFTDTGFQKRKEQAKSKDDMLLGSMGPASMVGVSELFKSFQLAGASNNQLEAEIKKKEMENAQALVDNSFKQTELLKKIAENPPVSRQ